LLHNTGGAGGQCDPQRGRPAARRPAVMRPPFREPHHSATQAAIIGGGPRSRPGEVSLAHRGVLFLDEMPELPRQSIEALRAPIETGRATIARAAAHVTYPARFQLVAAMNPCRCGHLGDATRECGRAPRCGEDYLSKISGPMLDRIDLCVQVQPVPATEISRTPKGECSSVVSARIAQSRKRQHSRFAAGRPVQRGGEHRAARTVRRRARPGGEGFGAPAPVRARLYPHAARVADHRRSRRPGPGRTAARGGGAELPASSSRPKLNTLAKLKIPARQAWRS